MEKNTSIKYKGGRPKKAIKKDQLLAMKCTLPERKIIEATAKETRLTVSEYLRQNGLNGKIDSIKKVIPGEVLQFNGTLNHLAANLNQIAKKRNGFDELNAMERALLELQSRELKNLVITIKNYLQ
jgi:hypothetical protein